VALTDTDLKHVIEQAIQHDLNALGQLYDHFAPQLKRYLDFRLAPGPTAHQVHRQVFDHYLAALQNQPQSTGDPARFLFTAAQRFTDQVLSQAVPTATPSNADPSGAAQKETEWLGQLVRRCLLKLTAEQQHLLALRFSTDSSIEEIARLIGRHPNQAKILQFDALEELRIQLGEED
jgi:DNA-directed RNA polymerase specialized sigma24 family protein